MNSLFENHQLNYDEVVRRLKHWAEQAAKGNHYAPDAIEVLADCMDRHKHALYFESNAGGQ